MTFLLSAYWIMVLLALAFTLAHALKADRIPLWFGVLFAVVALMISGVPK